MRNVKNPQMQIGEVDISQIRFDQKCRDDIPKILKGLQHIYITLPVREAVFGLLESRVNPKANKNNGRPGMELWRIFVMGVLRLDLNIDYDKLHHIVNHDRLIRQMLGHGTFDDDYEYQMQTIKDNVRLLTPELLLELNEIIVKAGHVLLKKKGSGPLRGRCDSFAVETNVHYPTDINLLYDAMRKVITLTARLCEKHGLSIWRQHAYNVRQVKILMRIAQNKKRSSAKTEEQKSKKDAAIVSAHQNYIDVTQSYLDRANLTLQKLSETSNLAIQDCLQINIILGFMDDAARQIDQINRRVLLGEMIPHHEKVFSIFQRHTEWIAKGKAGVPVELGVKVCILEDQHQFILHHMVMEKKSDEEVAISMVEESKNRFPNLSSCSFDKGFHSPNNQEILSKKLDVVALKRKGKLSRSAQEIETSEEFLKAHHKHSAVESAINALEVHGLDLCPDHGMDGFKRYVALAIVARNIHRIGAIITKREQKNLTRRKKKYFIHNSILKKAA